MIDPGVFSIFSKLFHRISAKTKTAEFYAKNRNRDGNKPPLIEAANTAIYDDEIVFSKVRLKEYLTNAFPEFGGENIDKAMEYLSDTGFKDRATARAERYLKVGPSLPQGKLREKLMAEDYFTYEEADAGASHAKTTHS